MLPVTLAMVLVTIQKPGHHVFNFLVFCSSNYKPGKRIALGWYCAATREPLLEGASRGIGGSIAQYYNKQTAAYLT